MWSSVDLCRVFQNRSIALLSYSQRHLRSHPLLHFTQSWNAVVETSVEFFLSFYFKLTWKYLSNLILSFVCYSVLHIQDRGTFPLPSLILPPSPPLLVSLSVGSWQRCWPQMHKCSCIFISMRKYVCVCMLHVCVYHMNAKCWCGQSLPLFRGYPPPHPLLLPLALLPV